MKLDCGHEPSPIAIEQGTVKCTKKDLLRYCEYAKTKETGHPKRLFTIRYSRFKWPNVKASLLLEEQITPHIAGKPIMFGSLVPWFSLAWCPSWRHD